MASKEKLTVIDLFAGCGGLGLGLEQAGFMPIFVNELNDDARETYLVNRERHYPLLRERYFSRDIADVVKSRSATDDLLDGFRRDYGLGRKGSVDLVVGGPPCQGFSSVGMRRSYGVDRHLHAPNHLYKDMAKFIRRVRPKAFLFENVEGLLRSRWTKAGDPGEIFQDVLKSFRSIPDYEVKHRLVYSKHYNVPQNRPRVLIIGFRADIFEGKNFSEDALEGGFIPKPTHDYPDLVDVLGDLVDPAFEYGGRTTSYPKKAESEFQERMRKDARLRPLFERVRLDEHEYSRHSERIQKKFQYMLDHGGRVHPAYQTKKFHTRLLPRRWGAEGPRITITSLPDDFVHYEQPRSLTVRECARMQTFPDWYKFRGLRTTGGLRRAGNPLDGNLNRTLPKYTQIANAVPVDLARAIGVHLSAILRKKS